MIWYYYIRVCAMGPCSWGARASWLSSTMQQFPPLVSFHRLPSVMVDCPFRLFKYRLSLLPPSACPLTNHLSLHRTLVGKKTKVQYPKIFIGSNQQLPSLFSIAIAHRAFSTMADDNAVHERICGWFLGPRAENATLFKKLLTSSVDQHVTRRETYQDDPPVFSFILPPRSEHLVHFVRTC